MQVTKYGNRIFTGNNIFMAAKGRIYIRWFGGREIAIWF